MRAGERLAEVAMDLNDVMATSPRLWGQSAPPPGSKPLRGAKHDMRFLTGSVAALG
jgi:hypothetical protein